MRFKLLLFTALLLSGSSGLAQDSPGPKRARTAADYTPRTLKEISALSAASQELKGREVLTGDLFPSRVGVTYQGSRRPVSETRKSIISQWARRYAGAPAHYTEPYQTELLFREDGKNYWLVVNEKLIEQFKPGQEAELNLIRLGAFKAKSKWYWVLLVESIAEA